MVVFTLLLPGLSKIMKIIKHFQMIPYLGKLDCPDYDVSHEVLLVVYPVYINQLYLLDAYFSSNFYDFGH